MAVECARQNAESNGLEAVFIKSDLFKRVEGTFDIVCVNPPYFPKAPQNEEELAWYCGEDFEYFQVLFHSLEEVMHASTRVFMVLSDGCDIDSIRSYANRNQYDLVLRSEKNFLLERNFIFEILKEPK